MSADDPLLLLMVLAFVGGMALWAVVRGVFRLIRLAVNLAVGFACGTWVFIHLDQWVGGWTEVDDRLRFGASVVAGAVGHWLARQVWRKAAGDSPPGKGRLTAWQAGLASLVPTAFFLWAGGTLTRLTTSLSALHQVDGSGLAEHRWVTRARHHLGSGVLGRVFEATDPFVDRRALRLCEVLVRFKRDGRQEILHAEPSLRALLAEPAFQRLLNDREVKESIAFGDYARLLTLPEVRSAASDPRLSAALREVPEMPVRRAEPVR